MANKKKTQVKKSATDRAVAIACIAFAVIIVAGLACSVLGNLGVFARSTTAISGSEKIEVNSAMMSYFLNENISTWYNNNYYYIDPYYASLFGMQYSIDLSSSLKTQTLNQNDATYLGATAYIGATWYDYFMDQTIAQVEELVIYAEAAYAVTEKDLTLTAEQKNEIKEAVASLKASLKSQKLSFSDVYGKGVMESDVRDCYELSYLASNFVEYKLEKLEEAIIADESNEAVNKYVEDNKESFYSADCLNYSITESRKDYTNDEQYKAAIEAAKAAAEKIAEAKSIEEFIAAIEAYEAAKNAGADEDETATETETKSFEEKVEDYKDEFKYSEDTDEEGLDDWLFGETPANVGNTNVFTEEGSVTGSAPALDKEEAANDTTGETDEAEETEAETESVETESVETESGSEEVETEKAPALSVTIKDDGKTAVYPTYTATAYYVVRANGINTELTHNFAYLVSHDKELLEKFIAEFNKGDKTLDKFMEAAAVVEEEYNAHHAEEDHEHSGNEIFEYNKLEDQPNEAFNSTYKVLNEWVEAGDRTDKSVSEIIEIAVDSTNTQYGVLFFENHGFETWYSVALNGDGETVEGLLSEQLSDWYEEACKTNPIKINAKAVQNITVVPYMSTTSTDSHAH